VKEKRSTNPEKKGIKPHQSEIKKKMTPKEAREFALSVACHSWPINNTK
jgi:hypothetical protein